MVDDLIEQWLATEAAEGVPPGDRSFAGGDPRAPLGVLLLHGATATPLDFRELADLLIADGGRVAAPLLPAHGRGPIALGDLRFDALVDRAEETFAALATEHARVALVAQSLGAVLALRIAARRSCAGLVALAPALVPFGGRRVFELVRLLVADPGVARATLRWQLQVRRGIAAIDRDLPRVTCPLLVFHSEDDTSVSIAGAHRLLDRSGSREKRLEVLADQGHVLTSAPDRATRIHPPLRSFLLDLSSRECRTRIRDPRSSTG